MKFPEPTGGTSPAGVAAACLLLLSALSVGCRDAARRAADAPPAAPTVGVTATAIVPTPQGVEFIAREAGFRLTIPALWRGQYTVKESAGPAAASDRLFARFFVDFRFVPPPGSGASDASLVAFVIYAKRDWEVIGRQPGPPLGLVLAEANNFVYVAQTPQSNPYDPGSAEGMLFDRMHRALDLRIAFALH